ncbi:MAG: 5-bromo-4-chloroindolyl phosphate hydrolysis protein [Proteobacteria bacterium]|nr:MAG: 5-bromo-4-chloroindolyl phosphate hydrolysis protein [Pseudomonadota bacterium]
MSKAKRYSPGQNPLGQLRLGLKGLLLYIMPMPVLLAAVISLVKGNLSGTLINGAAFAGFMLAAVIARHGFKVEHQYHTKKLALAPTTPYKTVAALLLAITTGVTAWLAADYNLLSSILIGAVTLLAFYLCYGLDPRRDKTGNIGLSVTAEEVFEALEAANIKIDAIETARTHINNAKFDQHLDRIIAKARNIIDVIESDPSDLPRARKFLTVYLDGTRRVTESYAKTHRNEATTVELDSNFANVLNSIESTFDEQHEKLKKQDRFDLDVNIEVLETQLKREGII